MATKKPKRTKPREWWLVVHPDGTVRNDRATETEAQQCARLFGCEVVRVREVRR